MFKTTAAVALSDLAAARRRSSHQTAATGNDRSAPIAMIPSYDPDLSQAMMGLGWGHHGLFWPAIIRYKSQTFRIQNSNHPLHYPTQTFQNSNHPLHFSTQTFQNSNHTLHDFMSLPAVAGFPALFEKSLPQTNVTWVVVSRGEPQKRIKAFAEMMQSFAHLESCAGSAPEAHWTVHRPSAGPCPRSRPMARATALRRLNGGTQML
jgi:hypothetical protein